jgi:replicative DNA helicase
MNSQFESQIIAGVVYDTTNVLFECRKAGITEKSFSDEFCAEAWRVIEKLVLKGKPIDGLRIADGMRDKYPDAMRNIEAAIDMMGDVSFVKSYVLDVKKAERSRTAKIIMADAAKKLDSEPETSDDHISEATAGLMRVGMKTDIPIKQLGDIRAGKVSQWRAAIDGGSVGVPFFLPKINASLGGWRKGSFSVIGAYRGTGKSTLVRQDAYENAREGRKALIFSLEDPYDIAGANIAGLHSGVDTFKLDTGILGESSINTINQRWAEIDDLPLWIVSCPVRIEDICAVTEMLHARYTLDIVYLDHIQYVQPLVLPHHNRVTTVGSYSLTLAGLAKRLDVPVVALSQLSREGEKENRRPRLSDLRDSGSIEQDARQVLLMSREDDKFFIEVAKNNYGPSGRTTEVWRMDGRNRFTDIDPYIRRVE